MSKEATARIKINKRLEKAGWRFSPEGSKPANIRLEQVATLKVMDLSGLGENFEKSKNGFVDDRVALVQKPSYQTEATWQSCPTYIQASNPANWKRSMLHGW